MFDDGKQLIREVYFQGQNVPPEPFLYHSASSHLCERNASPWRQTLNEKWKELCCSISRFQLLKKKTDKAMLVNKQTWWVKLLMRMLWLPLIFHSSCYGFKNCFIFSHQLKKLSLLSNFKTYSGIEFDKMSFLISIFKSQNLIQLLTTTWKTKIWIIRKMSFLIVNIHIRPVSVKVWTDAPRESLGAPQKT